MLSIFISSKQPHTHTTPLQKSFHHQQQPMMLVRTFHLSCCSVFHHDGQAKKGTAHSSKSIESWILWILIPKPNRENLLRCFGLQCVPGDRFSQSGPDSPTVGEGTRSNQSYSLSIPLFPHNLALWIINTDFIFLLSHFLFVCPCFGWKPARQEINCVPTGGGGRLGTGRMETLAWSIKVVRWLFCLGDTRTLQLASGKASILLMEVKICFQVR